MQRIASHCAAGSAYVLMADMWASKYEPPSSLSHRQCSSMRRSIRARQCCGCHMHQLEWVLSVLSACRGSQRAMHVTAECSALRFGVSRHQERLAAVAAAHEQLCCECSEQIMLTTSAAGSCQQLCSLWVKAALYTKTMSMSSACPSEHDCALWARTGMWPA